MKKSGIICLFLLASARLGAAQVSGGAGAYEGERGGINAANIERAKRQPSAAELKDDGNSTFVEAAVLMNARADEYVAVFALFAEAQTPELASQKMDETLANFSESLGKMGVAPADKHLDFVAQNRVYRFDTLTTENTGAKDDTRLIEKLDGFELKKNLSVRFRDIAKLDGFVAAAARAGIFDLVKVDYIVKDAPALQQKLQEQTLALIRQKAARYSANLGANLGEPRQIMADIPSVYFPVAQYDSYTAAESQTVGLPYDRSRYAILSARKSRSTYFAPLSGDGFDAVINPIIVEPVVQFTTYIKVKFAPAKPK